MRGRKRLQMLATVMEFEEAREDISAWRDGMRKKV